MPCSCSARAGFGLPTGAAGPGKGRMLLGREVEEEKNDMRGEDKTSILPKPLCFLRYQSSTWTSEGGSTGPDQTPSPAS